MDSLTIEPYGPPRLKAIQRALVARINAITPKAGIGTDVDHSDGGTMVHIKTQGSGPSQPPTSSGGGGTTELIYGALNGQPALFKVLVSGPPTPV